jgi:hypothetical protein
MTQTDDERVWPDLVRAWRRDLAREPDDGASVL